MIKVAIYCRLSDEDRGKEYGQDSESIQNQKSMLIEFAMQNGWNIYKIYSDDDFSGADSKRPEYNNLIKDAEERRFDIVLCKSQSRFTRDMEHVEKYIHGKFMEWGIRFIGKVDNADTEIKGNKKSRQINGLVNEWYLEDASENVKAALITKMKQGQFIGSFAPYGYKKNPANKNQLIIDEEAAEVVKQIFYMSLQGYGCHFIAKNLNDNGIMSPATYKRANGVNYNTFKTKTGVSLWDGSCVHSILKNRVYVGDLVQNKYGTVSYKNHKKTRKDQKDYIVIENVHEAIVSREDFCLVSDITSSRKRPTKSGKIDMFSGKLICGICGGTIYKNTTQHRKESISHYRCRTNRYSENACKGACISNKILEQSILTEFQHIADSYANYNGVVSMIAERNVEKEKTEKLELKKLQLQDKFQNLNKAFANLYLDKIKEVITEEQFIVISNQLTLEKKALDSQIESITADIEKSHKSSESLLVKADIISKYKSIQALNRAIVNTLIDHIVVTNTQNNNHKKLEIHWNF